MNRLSVRLVISHVMVALIGGLVAFSLVRWLAPTLFDESLRRGGIGRGAQAGQGMALRDQFSDAVDQALLIGVMAGVLAAAIFGAFAARRVIHSLSGVQAATRELAKGNYNVPVPEPKEAELAELARDVNHLGDELAQTETRRVRLLGEVAHELRTPLTIIDGYVEAMIDGVLPTTPENLGQIGEETRRLRRLSGDLSSLSKAEEGGLALQFTVSDAGHIARAAAERLRPQAEDAAVALVVRPLAGPLVVQCDPDRIAQVVTNLVGNALRATDPGQQISVSGRADHGHALIEVTDTGIGFDIDQVEKIFERFYRTPGARIGESGSGIGLTISRGIARAHGGELTATSSGPGQGATFALSLPLADSH